MTKDGSMSSVEILILVVSIANVCLLVMASFYGGHRLAGRIDAREKLGLAAVALGLSSQAFYLLTMVQWRAGFLDRDSLLAQLHIRFPSVGFLLSAGAFFVAWFGRGLRRYASLWVAVSSGFFWTLAGFAFLFSPL
jgi:hypothetical protein